MRYDGGRKIKIPCQDTRDKEPRRPPASENFLASWQGLDVFRGMGERLRERYALMKTPFAVDSNGTLFIKDNSTGIHPLVRMVDAIPMVKFGKEKHFYYRVSDIIDWHTQELAVSKGVSGNPAILEALKKAARMYAEGKCEAQ